MCGCNVRPADERVRRGRPSGTAYLGRVLRALRLILSNDRRGDGHLVLVEERFSPSALSPEMLRVVFPGLQSFVGLPTHNGQTHPIRGGVTVERDESWHLGGQRDHSLERLLPLSHVDIRAKPELEQRDHHLIALLLSQRSDSSLSRCSHTADVAVYL